MPSHHAREQSTTLRRPRRNTPDILSSSLPSQSYSHSHGASPSQAVILPFPSPRSTSPTLHMHHASSSSISSHFSIPQSIPSGSPSASPRASTTHLRADSKDWTRKGTPLGPPAVIGQGSMSSSGHGAASAVSSRRGLVWRPGRSSARVRGLMVLVTVMAGFMIVRRLLVGGDTISNTPPRSLSPLSPISLRQALSARTWQPTSGSPDLSYRSHLEQSTSPPAFTSHSTTLGFSHIYVLNLPHRSDRRLQMTKLAHALGLEFTFVNATTKDDSVIRWIGERVAEIRKMKRRHLARALGKQEEEIGGPLWLWSEGMSLTHGELEGQFPSLLGKDSRWLEGDWVRHLEASADAGDLRPERDDFNVTEALWDPLENERRQLSEPVIATWYSQTRMWNLMLDNGDESALFLEDDVDFEWDLERLWATAERKLPKDWEAAFLGHCWGMETTKPAWFHPSLRQATSPRCLHGYAFTRAGALHFRDSLLDPWLAYQSAIDAALPLLLPSVPLHAFSLTPPLIIQSKDTPSDILGGLGSPWRGTLADSTLERIWRAEGKGRTIDEAQMTWDQAIENPDPDPAVVWKVKVPKMREGSWSWRQREKMRREVKRYREFAVRLGGVGKAAAALEGLRMRKAGEVDRAGSAVGAADGGQKEESEEEEELVDGEIAVYRRVERRRRPLRIEGATAPREGPGKGALNFADDVDAADESQVEAVVPEDNSRSGVEELVLEVGSHD